MVRLVALVALAIGCSRPQPARDAAPRTSGRAAVLAPLDVRRSPAVPAESADAVIAIDAAETMRAELDAARLTAVDALPDERARTALLESDERVRDEVSAFGSFPEPWLRLVAMAANEAATERESAIIDEQRSNAMRSAILAELGSLE